MIRQWRARRALRWTFWLSLALVLLVCVALFLAPALLDLPLVRAKLERQLSNAAQGRVTWDALEVRLLPVPRGVLKGVRIDFREIVSGRIDAVELRLRPSMLLAGKVELTHLLVVRPVVRVDFSKLDSDRTAPRRDPIAVYRNAMQPVVDALRRFAPELALTVQDAQLDVIVPGLPTIEPVGLAADGRSDAQGLELNATATGKMLQRLRAKLRLEYADLKARVEIDGSGLKPQPLVDHYLSGAAVSVGLPSGEAHAEAHTDGKTALSATVTADVPALTLARGDQRVVLSAAHAQADVTARGEDVILTLTAVRLGELVPLASARLQLSGAPRSADASLEVPALDLTKVRFAAATLAGDNKLLRAYLARVRGGQAVELHVTAQAPDLKGLFDPATVEARLKLERAVMLAPYVEQDVTDISAGLAWSKGTLTARSVAGRLGQSRIAEGSVDYVLRDRRMSLGLNYDLDLAQALGLARQLLPRAQRGALDVVTSAAGRAEGRFTMELEPGTWKGDFAVARSDSLLHLRDVPWPVRVRAGRATVAPGRVSVADAAGAVGASTFSGVGVDLVPAKPLRLDGAHGSAALALAELYSWLRAQPGLKTQLEKVASMTGSVDVVVNRVAGAIDRIDTLQYEATLRPRRIRVDVADLPAPVFVDGGSVNVTPQALRFEAVVPALLDARAGVSGVVRDYRTKAPRVEASLANGEAGRAFMAWVWGRASAPEGLLPKTPMRFAAQRVRWSEADGLDVRASAQVDAGPAVEADVGWKPDGLDVRSVHIKDAESDATLGLLTRGRLLDTRFSGVLTGRSLAGLFAQSAGEHPGRAEGDIRATIDRDLRGRSTAQGRFIGQRIRLDWLLGMPLRLEQIDLDADGNSLRVNEATIANAEQKATLRGEARRSSTGLVIDAEIESPGIVLDALLPEQRETAAGGLALLERMAPEMLAIWPLPVQGKLKVRAGFVEYKRLRIEPLAATIDVEPERARLTVKTATLCGIEFPFGLEFTPQGLVASVRVRSKGKLLEATSGCLSDQQLLLTGEFNLRADLRTHGRRAELTSNLEGPVELHLGKGKVERSAFLTAILAQESVKSFLAKEGRRMDERGFEYREIVMRGHFAGGRWYVEEGLLDSPTLALAAKGSVGVDGHDARLTVLVVPFSRIQWLVRKVPILGYVFGGTLTSIPLGVSGNIHDPRVVPLSATAVASQLIGILERTFKLPGKLLTPLQEVGKPAEDAR